MEDARKKTQRLKIAVTAAALTVVCCMSAYAQTAAPAPAQKTTPAPTFGRICSMMNRIVCGAPNELS